MSWKLLREEWGAAVFVITVLIGLIAVPVAFSVRPPGTVSSGFEAAPATPLPAASDASLAREASASRTPTPTP